jgi:uncharacterized protein
MREAGEHSGVTLRPPPSTVGGAATSPSPGESGRASPSLGRNGQLSHGSDRGSHGPMILIVVLLVTGWLVRPLLAPVLDGPALQTWSTIFVALMVQALPFLVLGVIVSGAIAAFVPSSLVHRILPANRTAAVGVATCAGTLLPGCECGAVPISGRLISRGAAPAAALAFMLAAPAINPIVLVSTAVAFPGQPEMVLARFLASVTVAMAVGLIWMRLGNVDALLERVRGRATQQGTRTQVFTSVTSHDLLHAGGFLAIGAGVAATAQVVVPRSVLDTVAGSVLLSLAVMTTLAIVLSICSEADAFVASGFSQFPNISLLAFMVVGPVVDLKLVAMQVGVFGRDFALRFVPLTLAVALLTVGLVSWWLL